MIYEAVDGAMSQRRPAKKSQPKRLTESRLRAMIQESVTKILSEMTADEYKEAMQKHPGLMKKVDPLTYTNRYNYGKNAQGRKRNYDPETMRKASIDAFNRQYRTTGNAYYNMDPDFKVHDEVLNGDFTHRNTKYDPTSDTYETEYRGNDKDLKARGIDKNNRVQSGTGAPRTINRRENEKARQMVSGDGPYTYNPNSGWNYNENQ